MFQSTDTVRMHDTDMAGILYFAKAYRFCHDAWETLLESKNLSIRTIFEEQPYHVVIVHSEADYKFPLKCGDKLTINITILKIGNSSFTVDYQIYKEKTLAISAKTVHVTIDAKTKTKIKIPEEIRTHLQTL